MALLTVVFAAIISTVVWYCREERREMKLGVLCFLYWGASLMWLVDAIFKYAELRSKFFAPGMEQMANDLYLGLSAVALGLIIWLAILLIKDPKGVVKTVLFGKK